MFCPSCGKEIKEGSKFCSFCGTSLEPFEKVEVEKGKRDEIYGPWMRGISVFFGVLGLFGATNGWKWYFESGSTLVFFCEFFDLLISLSLLFIGLLPNSICPKLRIDTKDKFIAVVVILIVAGFVIVGIEPEPPGGWWYY